MAVPRDRPDIGHVAQARQVAGGDAQHLPLLELAQAAEGGLGDALALNAMLATLADEAARVDRAS